MSPVQIRPALVLATESLDPSGMGSHMLALGENLRSRYDVTVAASRECFGPLVTGAIDLGLAVKHFDDIAGFATWLQTGCVDLLHVHAGIGWEGHSLAQAGRSAGIPVVRTEHLPFLLTDEEQKLEFRKGLGAVERLIVVSDAARETFLNQDIDTSKIAVVRNGISALGKGGNARAQWGATSAKTLISIARFTAQKDHPTLVRAMPAVLKEFPEAVLLLVGSGPDISDIHDLVAELAIERSVLFGGRRDDIASLLASTDVFILASLFEGLPLVVLEAMSAGVPVVATAVGGTVEALGQDHPYLVEPGQPAALAEAIASLLRDPNAAKRTGDAERSRFARHFSAARMSAETEKIYQSILNSPKSKERQLMERARIGFVGVGGIANRHLEVLSGFKDVHLVAFADPEFDRAKDAALHFGAKAFPDAGAMLAGQELDAAYICIPPFAHGQVERDLIARRIPFFVEKPLTLNLKLASELAMAVGEAGLITAVGYHWRYLDTVEEARQRLRENPAQLVCGFWLDQTPPPQWWWKNHMSGGQMVEQVTHIIDLARYLVGDVTRVFGQITHKERENFPGLDVATASAASLSFASGAIGNIAATCALRWGHLIGLNIFCDGLAIELTDRDIMVDVGAGRPVRRAEQDPVWLEDRDFIDAVRGGGNRIRCSYQEALLSHRIALAIARSADLGIPIELKDFQED